MKNDIIKLLNGIFEICKDILISETIRIDIHENNTLGICECENNRIIIKRSVLTDPKKFCGVLAHEMCHYQHHYSDNTREFENDLTDMLGHTIYATITQNQSKV